MGIPAVIAIPDAQHRWKGRYVHQSGFPRWVGETLRVLVNRDGYTAAVSTLVHDNYGWSRLNRDESGPLGPVYDSGGFKIVPDYGVAYTTQNGQSSPNDWITADGDTWCAAYAYLLGEDGIVIFENNYPESWRRVTYVSYRDAEGMAKIAT